MGPTGKKAHHPVDSSDTLKIIPSQVFQTDILEEILLPAFDTSVYANRHISLLAHDATEASLLIACGNVSEGIGEVIKFAFLIEFLGHIVLQPEDLWYFHFDRHLPAHIAEQIMICGVHLFSFLHRAMIEPEDNIAISVKIGSSNRDRVVCFA